jgi:cell division protein FtsI (penicillin-binding protein 3)
MKRAKNHALLDVIEPGSVTKPFLVAAALEHKKTWLQEIHNCEKGHMRIGRRIIHDTHPAEMLSTSQTIVESSNICAYKIAMKMGPELFAKSMAEFGLGSQEISLDLPGEGRGWISNWKNWRDIRFANISFGQGFMATGLELVQAMGVIANGGLLMRPMLVERLTTSDGIIVSSTPSEQIRRVISPVVARQMRQVLARVVEDKKGTGSNAKTTWFSTAGKTGTAQKVDPGIKGYAKDKYVVSFLGFAPVKDPHLAIFVAVDEPREKPYYGGTWAAPIFSEIVDKSLRYLNVAPDKQPDVAEGSKHAIKPKS